MVDRLWLAKARSEHPTTERVSAPDLAELDWESPQAPMNIAAILVTRDELDHRELQGMLAQRVCAFPRLRQLVEHPTRWWGPAFWVPDPHFAIEHHVSVATCPPPGDENALLRLATAEACVLLPRSRPLWRAVLVTGLQGGRGALILVLHHAVADGVSSLEILRQLVDPTGARTTTSPMTADVGIDLSATTEPNHVVDRDAASARPRRLRSARILNQPVGPHRRLAVTTAPLAPLVAAAHRASATVNDFLLVAVGEALRTVLAADGHDLTSLVVSVPVSQRPSTTLDEIGNRVGVMLVPVPCDGSFARRVQHVAATTRGRRRSAHRSIRLSITRVVTGPAFRMLTELGLFQWFIGHQRLVNTFVTNLHGPSQQLTMLGTPIVAITPFSPIAGNVTVAFTALSYARTLSVTVVVDADRWPDANPIATALGRSLAAAMGAVIGDPPGSGFSYTPLGYRIET